MAKFCNVYNYIPSFCRYSDGTNASLVPVNWIIRKWQGKKEEEMHKIFFCFIYCTFHLFYESKCVQCMCMWRHVEQGIISMNILV